MGGCCYRVGDRAAVLCNRRQWCSVSQDHDAPWVQYAVVGFIGGALLCFLAAMLYAILIHQADPLEVRPTAPRVMGLPPAPQCDSLYNTGRHREWAACMGVGYDTKESVR